MLTGGSGVGKTLMFRELIQKLGRDEFVGIATDARLAPLDGLQARVIPAWLEPGLSKESRKVRADLIWEKIRQVGTDLEVAAKSSRVKMPKVLGFDGITNLGDILQSKHIIRGKSTYTNWGEYADDVLGLIGFFRGLQVKGLFRVFTCVTVPGEKDSLGRTPPELLIGTAGQLAPKHVYRFIDYHFHMDSFFDPKHEWAGPDGVVRRFQTCELDGVASKGAPGLSTPFMRASLWEVYRRVILKEQS